MQTTKFDYLELVNHVGVEYLSCYDKNTHEIIVLTEDEYEASNHDIICFPYKEDLVSYKEVVGELERATGEIFDLNRKGVAKRVREAGFTTQDIEDALLKKAWNAWLEENQII